MGLGTAGSKSSASNRRRHASAIGAAGQARARESFARPRVIESRRGAHARANSHVCAPCR
jgi:hypothetical protein